MDDGVRMGPATRDSGRKAVLEQWRAISGPIDWRPQSCDITGDDNIVHQSGRSHLTYISEDDEKSSVVDFVLVWMRQENG